MKRRCRSYRNKVCDNINLRKGFICLSLKILSIIVKKVSSKNDFASESNVFLGLDQELWHSEEKKEQAIFVEKMEWGEYKGFEDGKWKELENIILSEVTQTPKDKHEFGKLKYVHHTIDTYSGFQWAIALSSEKADSVIMHLLEVMAIMGIPAQIKTDNAPAYVSEESCENIDASINVEEIECSQLKSEDTSKPPMDIIQQ
ncbi:hypothetical protein STEG23_002249 [Scotinomys teguina]